MSLRIRLSALVLLALAPRAAAAPQGLPRVALAAAAANSFTDCRYTDLRDKLAQTGRFSAVDVLDVVTTTPGVPTLLQYDAVLTWGDVPYFDAVAMGDALATYVDQGGGVVVTGFANMTNMAGVYLAGRWLTGAYEVIRHTSGLQSGTADVGAVLDPSHPVVQGVASVTGMFMARPFLMANFGLNQGRVLLEWNDGRMLAAVSDVHAKRVDLGLYPVGSDCIPGFMNASSDGMRLVANALEYAANGGSLGTSYCAANPSSTGFTASVLIGGSTSIASNAMTLRAIGMPPLTNGYFLCSRTAGFTAMPGGSQGNLCLGGGIGRFLQQVQNSGATGSITIQPNLLALPTAMGPVAAQPGETWHFQAWFRDANPSVTSNFSRGARVTLQ